MVIIGLIFVFIAGALFEESLKSTSIFGLLGLIFLIVASLLLFSKGEGQVSGPSRLRPDQAYFVAGVIEHSDGRNVVIVNDYEDRLFAIQVPDSQLSVVKENQLVSVAGGSTEVQWLIPFPHQQTEVGENPSGTDLTKRQPSPAH